MKDLESRWDQFSLTEDENSVIEVDSIDLEDAAQKEERRLVCKLWSNRRVGKEVVRSTMTKIWKVSSSFSFQEVSTNLFVIVFECQEDARRVLKGKPWLFSSYVLVLKVFDGFTHLKQMKVDTEDFWIQLVNLPFVCMNREVGKQIGESIGVVKEIDEWRDGSGWEGIMRVKVELNLKRTIARGRTMNLLGKKYWIPLRYEKLPRMCFNCGVIVHGGEGCPKSGVGVNEK
ncbi:uncharacterized protein LOC122278524 [Carya illinoinensis]|uniref:uncharacterized protein LOC122278524 n=1 Tax=Carya illinoinensis TaxID=32201 RepID=UPI001C71CA23|nr:uncharacterized protein LOC122278524 [Carya illinoinensis]